jgi:hypothetical protein
MTNPLKPIDVVSKDTTAAAFYSKYLQSETVNITIPIHVAPATFYIYTTGDNMRYNFSVPTKVAYSGFQDLMPGLTKSPKPLYVGVNTLTIAGTGNVLVNYIEGRL